MELEAKKKEALLLLREYFEKIDVLSEKETDDIFFRLSKLSPDPEISDYVFYPKESELTPEQIIEKAFSYKPILL